MLRSTVRAAEGWNTLLGEPKVKPVTVKIPPGYGYVLTSKRSGTVLGMADAEFVQRAIFLETPHEDGKLVIALTLQEEFGLK
jgi:chitinase